MATTFDEVSRAQYVSLTTFTKDGRPKPTAIWIARDGDRSIEVLRHDPDAAPLPAAARAVLEPAGLTGRQPAIRGGTIACAANRCDDVGHAGPLRLPAHARKFAGSADLGIKHTA